MPSLRSLLARHQLAPMAAIPPGTMTTVSTPLGSAAFHREAARLAAEGRRVADRGIEQAGQAHVDAEGRRARHLGRNVEARLRLARQLELPTAA